MATVIVIEKGEVLIQDSGKDKRGKHLEVRFHDATKNGERFIKAGLDFFIDHKIMRADEIHRILSRICTGATIANNLGSGYFEEHDFLIKNDGTITQSIIVAFKEKVEEFESYFYEKNTQAVSLYFQKLDEGEYLYQFNSIQNIEDQTFME